ncbi:hypothetical protein M3P21_08725 [Ruegeria sp. 2012CJ41-6]|uniref:Uncharacterized protein n=1 Tax=Ruegeria spongiae TaxID=2942209 RepID=A0ABT0Q193_9RHOB|nr:hypothetical protein [Ruegeria spongiae]MCL6283619.1 hypothetical protein [Ruegeria spongiae]
MHTHWINEVLLDIAEFAKLNGMPELEAHVQCALLAAETQNGDADTLAETD